MQVRRGKGAAQVRRGRGGAQVPRGGREGEGQQWRGVWDCGGVGCASRWGFRVRICFPFSFFFIQPTCGPSLTSRALNEKKNTGTPLLFRASEKLGRAKRS